MRQRDLKLFRKILEDRKQEILSEADRAVGEMNNGTEDGYADPTDRASLERYAGELGLNASKFKSALDSKKLEARVDADAAEAGRSGVQGTPTFFINGQQLVGAQPLERFKALIDEELTKSKPAAEESKKTARK